MEDYFEGFSEDITKWEIIRELTDLELDDKEHGEHHKPDPGVQLLPRQDVMLYGTIPKMEQRIYSKCKECRLVFNPRDILSHKNCSGKVHFSHQNLKKKVKTKGSSSKKTHTNLPPPPLFKKPSSPPSSTVSTSTSNTLLELKVSVKKVVLPKIPKISTVSTTSTSLTSTNSTGRVDVRVSSSSAHVPKVSATHSPKSPLKSGSSHSHSPKALSKTATSTETTASTSTTHTSPSSSSSNSSSSRHKKSKRSNTSTKVTSTKEYDPDVHCGVVEGSRGPCTRSITCSNHRIQLRKLVPGRSKDIHHLIAERKAAKEKDLKHSSSSSCSYTSPNGSEEKETFCQNTSYVPIVAKIVNTIDSSPVTTTYVPSMPKASTQSRHITTSVLASKKSKVIENENESARAVTNGYLSQTQNLENNSQESAMGTVPVVYMPMSPISVVSPVQFVQIGNNMLCLESPQSAMSPPLKNNSVFLSLANNSNQHSNVKIYKSHPKPVVLPTFGTKKVGGAILLSNPRVESQRNELLTTLNSKRKTVNNNRTVSLLNHTNNSHRPNILKVKSITKANCKRTATEKLTTSDSKQMRLVPDANGFILHADVSETADAPQSNNSIQEKIALLNMK